MCQSMNARVYVCGYACMYACAHVRPSEKIAYVCDGVKHCIHISIKCARSQLKFQVMSCSCAVY